MKFMIRIYHSTVFIRGKIFNGIRKFDDNQMRECPKFQHVNQRGNKINSLMCRVDI